MKQSIIVTSKSFNQWLLRFIAATLLTFGASPLAQSQSDPVLQIPSSGRVTVLYNQVYNYGTHKGLDIAASGSTVVAAAAGKVVYIEKGTQDYGHFIVIYHGFLKNKHVYTLYGHMGKKSDGGATTYITAKLGQDVLAGTPLGQQGDIGLTTGVHLHWSVLVSNAPILDNGNSVVWARNHLSDLQYDSPNNYTNLKLTAGDSNSELNHNLTAPAFNPRSTSAGWQPNGTIINENGTLRLIEGGKRRGFQSADRFTSNGYDFTQAIIATAPSCLDSGDLMNAPPTYRFYRQQNGAIYFVTERNRKRLFTSYAAYLGRFDGSSLQNYELSNIQNDTAYFHINSPFHEGTLVRQKDNSAVYVISDGNARLIASEAVFLRLGYRWKDVIVLSSDVFDTIGRDELHPITDSLIDSCDGNVGGASDEFAPNLTINSPADGQTFSGSVITVAGTASDFGRGESGISSVRVNGSRASNDTATVSATANWSRSITLNPGANDITVIAKDSSQAQNAATRTLTVYFQAAPTPTPPPANPTFTSVVAVNPNPAVINQSSGIQVSFTSNPGAGDVITNTEIYDANNQRVFQGFTEHRNFSSGQTLTDSWNWTPSTTGQFTVKTAVFSSNWSNTHHWNDAALVFSVGNVSQPPTAPGFSSTASGTPNPAILNQPVSISATVTNSGGAVSDVIVDVEVYDSAGNRAFQNFFEHQDFTINSSRAYAPSWTPTATGQFTVKIGIFRNDWGANYSWNESAAIITVNASPPPTPAYDINVWWVTDGVQVSGTQPLKAVVNNLGLSEYSMSWQVDGGALVPMADNYQDAPHKEASVDLSGWTWRGTGAYNVNFVAKDASGNIVAQRSVNIYVSH